MLNRSKKHLIGQLFWFLLLIAAAIAGFEFANSGGNHDVRRVTGSVTRFLVSPGQKISLEDPLGRLQLGDPVFLAAGDAYRQVGRVGSVNPDDDRVEVIWYASSVSADQCQLFQYHATGQLTEVVEILMPPEKRERIRKRMAIALAEHGRELSDSFVPLVRETLKQSLPVIEQEFKASVSRHRGEIDHAAERWNREVIERRLIPLARREILPIVQKHGQPPAEEIGREIWDRASLFRFGWRALYDKTPLPKKDLVQEEWQRFVRDEAVPVLESHMDEIVEAIQGSMRDIASNEEVRRELGAVADEIASDPESRELIQTILKESLIDNQRLRSVWQEVWSSKQAEQAIEAAGRKLEPVVRQIGDEIFGSEQEGIDPNFARVLRSQILHRDRRWIVAWHTGANNGTVEVSSKTMPYPTVYLASKD